MTNQEVQKEALSNLSESLKASEMLAIIITLSEDGQLGLYEYMHESPTKHNSLLIILQDAITMLKDEERERLIKLQQN